MKKQRVQFFIVGTCVRPRIGEERLCWICRIAYTLIAIGLLATLLTGVARP